MEKRRGEQLPEEGRSKGKHRVEKTPDEEEKWEQETQKRVAIVQQEFARREETPEGELAMATFRMPLPRFMDNPASSMHHLAAEKPEDATLTRQQQEIQKRVARREQEVARREQEYRENEAMDIFESFKEHPAVLFRMYETLPAGLRGALKSLLVSERDTLSPEMQKQFAPVLQPSPIVESVSRKAFSGEFYGDGPHRFYQALDKIHRNEQFARVVGMFQASGWGKSRLVKELHAQEVWVVYLSLGSGSCYPKPSLFAREFEEDLRERIGYGGLAGEVQCMNYCLAFWICCIHAVVKLSSRMSRAEFAKMMTDDCGKDFWPLVQDSMEADLVRISDGCVVHPKEGQNRLQFLDSWDDAAASVLTNEASESLMVLCGSSKSLKLLFVIDDARQLLPNQGQEELNKNGVAENLYLPLRRSTRALKSSLVLLMDTSSRVSNFLGAEWKDPSTRSQKPVSGFYLPAPLVGFFEGDVGRNSKQGSTGGVVKSFKDITADHEMVRFGRPLWWSLYQGGASLDRVMAVALVKLTGHLTPDLCKSDEALISVVGSRCGLYVDPSSQLAADLVAHHGMTVLYVSPDTNLVNGSRVYGAWPVEPVLAEVAYSAMRAIIRDSAKGYRFLYEPIQRKLSEGLLNAGELGEVLVRIILLEAIDNAREREGRAWITVDEFVRELFGSRIVQEWINSAAAYQKEKLHKLLKGKLLVNAFHRVYKRSSELSAEDIKVAFEARCGIVAAAGTWGVDFHIPVHLGGLKKPLNQTLLYIQLKVHERCGSIELAKLSSQYSGITFLRPGVPYMGLAINLVGQSKVELKHSHAVWEAVVNSENKEILVALKCLEENGTMDTLRRNVKAVVGSSTEEKAPGEYSKAPGEYSKAARRQKARKVSKEHPAHKRWQQWIQADWRDQIIVKARGLDSLNLHEDLKACLVDMLSIQVNPTRMRSLKPAKLDALEESRFALTEENWELQQEMLNKMFGIRNVQQLVWQK